MTASVARSRLTLCDPESVGLSRPESWSGEPVSPGDLPNPGIEAWSPALHGSSSHPWFPALRPQAAVLLTQEGSTQTFLAGPRPRHLPA